jgi:hypothetical protein
VAEGLWLTNHSRFDSAGVLASQATAR